jgi:putative nucleotidyltransferase with HDIG domain
MKQTNAPDYGQGTAYALLETLAAKDRGAGFTCSLIDVISKALAAPDFQPPLLPEVAISLTRLAGQPDVSLVQVEEVVTRDPSVAARVLSVANSAYYSRGQSVKSLRDAIARVGLAEVRDVAYHVVASTQVFKEPAYSPRMRELLDAAQAGGLLAKEVCLALRFEKDLAYLCGLLHDMGEAIILSIIGNACRLRGLAPPKLDQLRGTIAQLHATAGARVCSAWKLPPRIVDAVANHHQLDQADPSSQMAAVVAVADLLLAHAGIGVPRCAVDPMREPLFYRLNLTPQAVRALLDEAEKLGKEMQGGA